jgi:hypothetical protein
MGLPLGVVILSLSCGCGPYIGDYQFSPRPLLAQVPRASPQTAPPLTVLASVIGVHRSDSKLAIPQSVEVRLRLENPGPGAVNFNPQTLELTNGELLRFAPPITRPPQAFTIAPGQSVLQMAYFPFPPDHCYSNTDLESLQLRWMVQVDGRNIAQVANFRRTYPRYYYYPYWSYDGAYPVYGPSFVFVHR